MRPSLGLALFLAASSSQAVAFVQETQTCRDAFGVDAAGEVFDRLRMETGADGCSLADLRTERTRMKVLWTKHGEPMPEAFIDPAGCSVAPTVSGDILALTSPPELSAACPDALSAMASAVRALHPRMAEHHPAYSRRLAFASWGGVALAFVGAIAALVRALRGGLPET
jgi:hypothetical protein